MGEVFLALDTRLNRKVALKLLPEGLRSDPVARMRLVHEAKAAAILDHPFVCKIYEAAEYEDHVYIAMEYVEGRTLRERLMEGPMPLKEIVRTATEIAEALEVAHDHGIVHRDLKPSNIMLGRVGHVKVMDFGLAKQLRRALGSDATETVASSLTIPGSIIGTIDYMSPEQLRGQDVDSRSDIFSFGIILYEAVTGAHPFRKQFAVDTASAILACNPPPARPHAAAFPPFLDHVICKALARNPADRYQTVRDLITDLHLVRPEGISEAGRRLAAIMLTDIVGYGAITQRNEALAMQLLEEHWRLLRPIFARHDGQEVKTIGDAFLVEFSSALQAIQCAVEIQRTLFERNRTVEPERRVELRIGLHLGDVIHRDNDVFGEGVNFVSRIEPLAERGGICISEDMAHQVRNKIELPLAEIVNEEKLKEFERPMKAFRIVLPWMGERSPEAPGTVPFAGPDRLTDGAERSARTISAIVEPGAVCSDAAAILEPTPIPAVRKAHWWWPSSRFLQWLLGFSTALALVFGIMMIPWLTSSKPVLSFAPRDWILITDFDNLTGEPTFDKSLGTAISVSIEQSKHANVFPRSRIAAALQRMGKPPNQKVDDQIGREICVRERIRGLVVPSISKVGQQYTIAARIVDPQTGDTVRSYLEQVSNQNEILSKLSHLASEIRRDLGESLGSIQLSSRDLMHVTTPSLEALKLYTDGAYLWGKGQYGESVQLYESAVKIDPNFAKAHSALGMCYASFIFNDRIKAKEHFEKAISLVDRVTERERQTIQISYEGSLENTQNELNLCRVYLQAYPDDYSMRYNYGNSLRDSGQTEEAIAQYQEVLRLAPSFTGAQINLATCYSGLKKYPEALKAYAKAFEAEPTWLTLGNLNHEYGFALVEAGRLTEAREVFTKALPTNSRTAALRSLAMLDLCLGKYASAKKSLDEAILLNIAGKAGLSEARNHLYMAILLDGQGRASSALQELDKGSKIMETIQPQVWLTSRLGVAYVRGGELPKAVRALEKIRKEAQMNVAAQAGEVNRLEGEIELAKGNRAKAVEFLTVADRQYQPSIRSFTIESLARAYRLAGDASASIAQYEQLLDRENKSLGFETQQDWLGAHYHLARLYQSQGQKEKAQRLVDKLLQLWSEADPELPLLRDTRRLRAELGK